MHSDNSAGFLSITRGLSELTDLFRDSRITNMSPETLIKVVPAETWDTFDLSTGELGNTVKNILVEAGIPIAQTGIKKWSQVAALKFANKNLADAVKNKITKAIAKKAPKLLSKMVSKEIAAGAYGAAAKGLGKLGSRLLGAAATVGLDASFFYMDAGKDMAAVRESFAEIKNLQATLRTAAMKGETPPDLQSLIMGLQTSIENVNILSQRHGLNVKLDMNNILSNRVLRKLQQSMVIDTPPAPTYTAPTQMSSPRAAMSFDQIGSK